MASYNDVLKSLQKLPGQGVASKWAMQDMKKKVEAAAAVSTKKTEPVKVMTPAEMRGVLGIKETPAQQPVPPAVKKPEEMRAFLGIKEAPVQQPVVPAVKKPEEVRAILGISAGPDVISKVQSYFENGDIMGAYRYARKNFDKLDNNWRSRLNTAMGAPEDFYKGTSAEERERRLEEEISRLQQEKTVTGRSGKSTDGINIEIQALQTELRELRKNPSTIFDRDVEMWYTAENLQKQVDDDRRQRARLRPGASENDEYISPAERQTARENMLNSNATAGTIAAIQLADVLMAMEQAETPEEAKKLLPLFEKFAKKADASYDMANRINAESKRWAATLPTPEEAQQRIGELDAQIGINDNRIMALTGERPNHLTRTGNPEVDALLEENSQLLRERTELEDGIGYYYAFLPQRDNFALVAEHGKKLKNPTLEEFLSMPAGEAKKSLGNKVVFYRGIDTELLRKSNHPDDTSAFDEEWEWYQKMTQEEVDTYSYLLVKEGDAAAQNYLDSIHEQVTLRIGRDRSAEMEGKPLRQGLEAALAGVSGFASGVKQNFSPERVETTVHQATNQANIERAGTLGKGALNIVTTISNMLPSIAVSTVTGNPLAGAATLGLSARGNAMNAALSEGYDYADAEMYGTLVGVLEGSLQYALGGISKLGGKLTGNALSGFVQNFTSAALRTAVQVGGQMVSEGFEEYLTEILDPVIRNMAFAEDNRFSLYTEEALEAFLMGAITSFIMEGAGDTVSGINYGRQGAGVLSNSEYTDRLIREAALLGTHTEAGKLAVELLNGETAKTTYNLGQLQSLAKAEGIDVAALQRETKNAASGETTGVGTPQYSFKGYDPVTGRGIYESNFPKGTPKAAKGQRVLELVQNVWSKKPIDLVVRNDDGSTRTIQAQFDPTYDPSGNTPSDLTKLMGGNRHGTSSEQRVTLDIADDYYQIASEAVYNGHKPETGKDSPTHENVKEWHYFVNDILFQEYGEEATTPYRVTVNVKEKPDGSFVYSFNADRQNNEELGTRRTLHADVNQSEKNGEANAQLFNTSIPDTNENSNSKNSTQAVPGLLGYAGVEPKRWFAFHRAEKIAKRFGLNFRVQQLANDADGQYLNGTVTISPTAQNPVRQVLIHELTHHMENSGLYESFSNMILNYAADKMQVDVESVKQQIIEQYTAAGTELDEVGATKELVAKYAEEYLFQDEAAVRQLLRQDRNVFDKIYNWICDTLEALSGKDSDLTEAEQFLREAEALYKRALEDAGTAADVATVGSAAQNSYAGVNAKTADFAALSRAQELERQNVADDVIRQETGWFRGDDGKWRFEIDDSQMEYYRSGDAQFRQDHPEYVRQQELTEKFTDGTITEAEHQELLTLNETWGREQRRLAGRVAAGNATLQNLIEHDALFEAYPELRNARVVFGKLDSQTKGSYDRNTNTITIREDLRKAPESTLLHEIQHAVQNIEGFTGGSSVEYWQSRIDNGEVFRAKDGHVMTASELYEQTAGENEAGNVASRRKLSADERKNTPPKLLGEDATFAEGTVVGLDKDPRTLTKEEAIEIIEKANQGEFSLRSFVPVRSKTPSVLIAAAKKMGLTDVSERPLATSVEHIQQTMDPDVAANDGKRGHALTAGQISEIIDNMDNPRKIYYQQDNQRYTMIVDYHNDQRTEKAMAIVDAKSNSKDKEYLNGYQGGYYNILVTTFSPESKYYKKYVANENNVLIYDKTKDAPQSDSGSLVPSYLNGTSFNTSIRSSSEKNNPQNAEGQNSIGSSFSELAERAGADPSTTPDGSAQDDTNARTEPLDDGMRHVPWIDETMYGVRYSELQGEKKELYNSAKEGSFESAAALIESVLSEEKLRAIKSFGEDVFLLPVIGRESTSKNVIPSFLAGYIERRTGQQVFDGIYQQERLNRRSLSAEERLFGSPAKFDIGAEIGYADLKGKRFLIIDDNSSYGSTIRGLETFLREHGAEPVGAFTLTVGGDSAQYLTATQETWDELDRKVGLKYAERYAREKGFSGDFTREHVGQRLAEQLLHAAAGNGIGSNGHKEISGGISEISGRQSGQSGRQVVTTNAQNSIGSSFSELAERAGTDPSTTPDGSAQDDTEARTEPLDDDFYDLDEQGTLDEYLEALANQEMMEMFPATEEEARARAQDLDEYFDLLQRTADRMGPPATPPTDGSELVNAKTAKNREPLGRKIRNGWNYFKRKMVDSGTTVTDIGKSTGDRHLYHYYNMARASSNAAISMITGNRTDVNGRSTGKGLNAIFDPIRQRGEDFYNSFQLYLFHRHNVDRMSRESQTNVDAAREAFEDFKRTNPELNGYAEYQIEQMAQDETSPYYFEAEEFLRLRNAMQHAERVRNLPVFGETHNAQSSRELADRLLQENPEFAELAKEVYDYVDNLMQYRVDSGLITEEDRQFLHSVYPHYVPTYRITEQQAGGRRTNSVQIGSTIGRAEGGDSALMPLHKALAMQTMNVVREGSKNRFGQRLMNSNTNRTEHIRNVQEAENVFHENTFDAETPEVEEVTNRFIVRENGRRYEMEVSPELYEAVKALSPDTQETNVATKIVRKGNDLFKKLVTGYNPLFLVRNFFRDLQDAAFYSKDLSEFAKQYPQAWREIATNGEYWQRYKALGGTYSSIFDYDTGETERGGWVKRNIIDRIELLNQAVEQAPRLAEFMATVEKHGGLDADMDTAMEAMYNAADITVNFGRSGTLGKALNANYIPFLNPSIQGFDKMIRNVTETKGAKNWFRLIGKAALFGFAPTLLNGLLYEDDDEWEDIKKSDKDTNYLFKLRDGLWLKIPKGRTLSLLGMTADRTKDAAKGKSVDWGGFIQTAAAQTAPANPLEQNILKAWFDADLLDKESPGKTWYGGDIENQRLQGYAAGQRYDAKTDVVSRWLGEKLDLSPKKINYLLDQYSGVVGDVLLPLLTPTAERDMFTAAFTIDSTASNRLSQDFYNTLDELTHRKNDPAATGEDAVMYRFWNKQGSAIGEVNKAIRDIEADDSLPDKEKRDLLRAQYAIRNGIIKAAEGNYDDYEEAVQKYYAKAQGTKAEKEDYAYLMANWGVLGAEYALANYNKSAYEKAQGLNAEGISYDKSLEIYLDFKAADDLPTADAYRREREIVAGSGLTEEEKVKVYQSFISDKKDDDIGAFLDAGMSFDDYLHYEAAVYGLGSDDTSTKKEKVMGVIHAMDITQEQKDAAYLVAGYSEKTIDEAPWNGGKKKPAKSKVEELALPMPPRSESGKQGGKKLTAAELELPLLPGMKLQHPELPKVEVPKVPDLPWPGRR